MKPSLRDEKLPVTNTVLSFLICLCLCSVIVSMTIINRNDVERLEMEQLIMEKSAAISDVISRLLYKTEALAALVVQGDGEIKDFARVAATLCDDPAILNVLAAPNGVVEDVYPLKGNESVIGLDFFSEGNGNKEAVLAKELGQLVFGGPFTLVQGYEALVGRLPVYVEDPSGSQRFWGLVSVTLKYPDALSAVGLERLENRGYSYEIWRNNPDDGKPQVIATSSKAYNEKSRYIEKEIRILNATWYMKVAPVRMWYQYMENWVLVAACLFISLLVASVVQNNAMLRKMKAQMEQIAHQDGLTGLFTRRYFLDSVRTGLAKRQKGCIVIFDVDKFKQINDSYGHAIGDDVLVGIAKRIRNRLRDHDLFARYGGEEFIIFFQDVTPEQALNLAKRLSTTISQDPFATRTASICVTASFGIAYAGEGLSLEESIDRADKAMYQAKKAGRNQVAVYAE